MKIINAFWEERNLGETTIEFQVNKQDSQEEVINAIKESNSYKYCVAKVDTPNVEAQKLLSENGFAYIESSINMFLDIRNFRLTPLQERINKAITYRSIKEFQLSAFEQKLKKGIFDTDRIFLDSHFSKDIAASRYFNWISDELTRGTELFEILYKEKEIGFFTQKKIDEFTYYPFLAGLYEESSCIVGIGFSVLAKPIEDAMKRGGKAISTYVSSNNLPIVRLHVQLGFVPNNFSSVFVKHNSL